MDVVWSHVLLYWSIKAVKLSERKKYSIFKLITYF